MSALHVETTWLVRISAKSSLHTQVEKLVLDTLSGDLLRLIKTTKTAIISKCQNVVLTILVTVLSCQQSMEHYFNDLYPFVTPCCFTSAFRS